MDLGLFSQINYVAVLVAAILYFALGALWYSPVLFAKPWMESIGLKPEDMDGTSPLIYLAPIIFYLIAALITAFLIKAIGITSIFGGLLLGFFGWLGFMLPGVGSSSVFQAQNFPQPMNLFKITIGYHLIGFLILGGLLAVWQ